MCAYKLFAKKICHIWTIFVFYFIYVILFIMIAIIVATISISILLSLFHILFPIPVRIIKSTGIIILIIIEHIFNLRIQRS